MKTSEIPYRVHFVGIGGVGMSALAQHLHNMGHIVTGSDRTPNERTQYLQNTGITVHIGHSKDNLGSAKMVVRTSAVHSDNPEITEAIKRNTPIVLREELLGAVFNEYPVRIAVCGTHGKTTVTAMIHHVLKSVNVEHTAFIGGLYEGNNYYYGKNVAVAEACEYNRSFLNLRPTVTVCLNAEFDHPDCYKNLADVRKAFRQFTLNTDTQGVVVLHNSLSGLCKRRRCVYFGDNAFDIQLHGGKPSFSVSQNGMTASVSLNVAGVHNVNNALAVIAAASELGIPLTQTLNALSTFGGVDRRFTVCGVFNNIICDYAHHPTEIACSVSTAKSVTQGKVYCVFQPHTYSRTKALFSEFVTCFSQADEVAYLPVYSARELPVAGADSQSLAKKAVNQGINAVFLPDFQSAKLWAEKRVTPHDVLLILGAGDVAELAPMLSLR